MAQLCTGMRGFDSCASLAEGIARGRLGLTQITGCDFGYDIKAWFDHLAQHKMYDIACRSKPGNYPGFVLTALENPDWLNAVEQAEAGLEFETIRKELQRSQSARRDAELKWSGQERTCPKCKTSFTSIKDRGQCTQCGFVFLASNP
jgi:ribosomal protein S27AE